ncbi:MAG: JAB domain-containing protein [Candidatus Omnitrophica bacterium]|nr:JAB domain-containing protein [Candidatus Omnitrophota bacterium]
MERYVLKTIKIALSKEALPENKTQIQSSEEAYYILKDIYKNLDADQEHYVLLCLDTNLKITGFKILFSCGQRKSYVDCKVLFRNALLLGAVAIIIAHNHPAGNIEPSQEDIMLTEKIKKACEVLDIVLLDHIIISPNDGEYFSFRQKNKI